MKSSRRDLFIDKVVLKKITKLRSSLVLSSQAKRIWAYQREGLLITVHESGGTVN